MARILVGYGTKNGGTAGIADKIGEVLADSGHDVTVTEAGKARLRDGYDAAVVGSSLYAGMWRRSAKRLIKRLASAPTIPLWLFHSGPLGEDEADDAQDFPKWLAGLEGRLDIRDKTTFGGVLDEHAKGFIASSMVKNGRGGDFRDWDAIAAWAGRIAAEV